MNRMEWEEYFKDLGIRLKTTISTKIVPEGELWEVMLMVYPDEDEGKIEEEWMCVPKTTSKASYVLHCKKCGKWFFNGWYQSRCQCGNELPSGYMYP